MMRKCVCCKDCSHSIPVRSWWNDWDVFVKEKGEILELGCKRCGAMREYSVHDVYAEHNVVLNMVLFLVVLVLMCMIGDYLFSNYWGKTFSGYAVFPVGIAFPPVVYLAYLHAENLKIRNFNRLAKRK